MRRKVYLTVHIGWMPRYILKEEDLRRCVCIFDWYFWGGGGGEGGGYTPILYTGRGVIIYLGGNLV